LVGSDEVLCRFRFFGLRIVELAGRKLYFPISGLAILVSLYEIGVSVVSFIRDQGISESEIPIFLGDAGFISLNGYFDYEHLTIQWYTVAVLVLGREKPRDGPLDNIQESLAVRKQDPHLTNFDLIRADLYPKGNNHLRLS